MEAIIVHQFGKSWSLVAWFRLWIADAPFFERTNMALLLPSIYDIDPIFF
jgi:hypothetical protein